MEEKYNDSTEQRPEGERSMDGWLLLTCRYLWNKLNRNPPGRTATGMP